MTDLEIRLVEGMRDAVAGVQVPPGLVARARPTARSRRWRRPVTVVAATGLAAAVAVGVSLVVHGLPDRLSAVPAAVPAHVFERVAPDTSTPPQASPLAAARRSFRIDLVDVADPLAKSGTPVRTTYNGLYGPARDSGEGVQGVQTSRRPIRLIGSTYFKGRYTGSLADPWLSGPGGFYDALLPDGSRIWGSWNGENADAAQLLAHLRDVGTVKPEKPTGKGQARLDHYSFTYTAALGATQHAYPTTGRLTVWHKSGLVTTLSQRTVVEKRPDATKTDPDPGTYSRTLKFWDYDVPVYVQAPPPASTRPE